MPDGPPKVELLQIQKAPNSDFVMLGLVKNLIPFQNLQVSIGLEGDVIRSSPNLCLKFALKDPDKRLATPEAFKINGDQVPREDGLWKDTCFELFLQPEGQTAYYEFNFSLKPAWNAYHFQEYRKPQPPTPTQDFQLRSMNWDGHILTLDLFSRYPIMEFSASLTAVLKERTGATHYMAIAHKGEKADFHLKESFILKR